MAEGQAQTSPATADDEIDLGRLSGYHGYWLRRASASATAHFMDALQGTGMRPVLYAIMMVVDENPGLNQGQLGRALGVQRANMVSLIGDLTERGLIERRDVPGDKRAFALHLTAQGKAMRDELAERVDRHEEEMLATLNGEEREALLDLLKRVETASR